MSTPEANLANNAPTDGAMAGVEITGALEGLPGEDLSWLTETHIDDVSNTQAAPLPADAGSAGAEPKPQGEGDQASTAVKEPPAAADPLAAAAKDEGASDLEAAVAEELTPKDQELINALPEAERAAATEVAQRKRSFGAHYLGNTPITDITTHLHDLSPVRYGELQNAVIGEQLANPGDFCRSYYKRDPEGYSQLAREVFNGAPQLFTKMAVGTERQPEEVKTALEFYDRNKDRITDTGDETLLTQEELAEIEHYQGKDMRDKIEAMNLAAVESQAAKAEPAKTEAADDPAKLAEEQQAQLAVQREVQDLWDLGRDTIGNHVMTIAADPEKGAGIFVSPEERQAAEKTPESTAGRVVLLKDLKADILINGFSIGGKMVIPDLHSGLVEWAKERGGFKDAMLMMDRYTQAREKSNVLATAQQVFPLATGYYEDRLNHPIFKALDDVIGVMAKSGNAAPRLDPHIAPSLPSPSGGAGKQVPAKANAHSDDYLIADAVSRSR